MCTIMFCDTEVVSCTVLTHSYPALTNNSAVISTWLTNKKNRVSLCPIPPPFWFTRVHTFKMKIHTPSAEFCLFTHNCYRCFCVQIRSQAKRLVGLQQTKDYKFCHGWVGLYDFNDCGQRLKILSAILNSSRNKLISIAHLKQRWWTDVLYKNSGKRKCQQSRPWKSCVYPSRIQDEINVSK